jgi:transposase
MPLKREIRPPTRPKGRVAFKPTYNAASPSTVRSFIEYWSKGLPIPQIANLVGIAEITGYKWQANLRDHGSIRAENQLPAGRPNSLTVADEKALLQKLLSSCWLHLDEMVAWLHIERGVEVSESTVCRALQRNGWTRKKLEIGSNLQRAELRQDYLVEMQKYAADRLVFIDESIFNEKTGWRTKGRAPMGRPAKVRGNINRGKSWSFLPAYTIDGYLPCHGIKQGYFNREEFLDWIEHRLLPTIAEKYPNETMVVVLDNVSIHTTGALNRLIQEAGHVVKFLPPYSPDYNPIELTFSVLKAWMKKNYFHERGEYPSYGDYLAMAIADSRCDRFSEEHFRHAAKGWYLLRDAWEALQERNRLADLGHIDDAEEELME